MEAVVMQLKEGKAAVLDKEGIVRIVDDGGYHIGQRIEVGGSLIEDDKKSGRILSFSRTGRSFARTAAAVAASVLIFAGAGGATAYAVPCAEVSLDVNPSFRYEINIFNRVLTVDAYNGDGEEYLDAVKLVSRGKSTGAAIENTLGLLEDEYFPEDEENGVLLSVTGSVDGAVSRIRRDIEASEERHNQSASAKGPVRFEEMEVSGELRKEARERGISPGKLAKVREIEERVPEEERETFDEAEWLKRPVRELNDELERVSGAGNEEPSGKMPPDVPAGMTGNDNDGNAKDEAVENTDRPGDDDAVTPGEMPGEMPDAGSTAPPSEPAYPGDRRDGQLSDADREPPQDMPAEQLPPSEEDKYPETGDVRPAQPEQGQEPGGTPQNEPRDGEPPEAPPGNNDTAGMEQGGPPEMPPDASAGTEQPGPPDMQGGPGPERPGPPPQGVPAD